MAENTCCIDYANTWSCRHVHWLWKVKVCIMVLPTMDVKTYWYSTLEWLVWVYQFLEFTHKWLQNPAFCDYWPLLTKQHKWTIIKYVMEVVRPFQYWNLRMSMRHMVTLPHIITVYDDMFDHMDSIVQALAQKMSQSKQGMYFALKVARQKLSEYYTNVPPPMGMLLISVHLLDPFQKFWLYRTWDKGMDIHSEDETSYTTIYHEAFLICEENEFCVTHQCMVVNKPKGIPSNNHFPWAAASGSRQSSLNPNHLSCDDQEYLMPNHVADMTPMQSDHSACLWTTPWLNSNSRPNTTRNWGQINRNLDDYRSDRKEICSIGRIPDITDCRRQWEEMQSKYANISSLTRDIFSIIPHAVGVEARLYLGQDVMELWQSKTTPQTLPGNVVVTQFPQANASILAGDDPALDPMNT